jgi:hypothetical protein
LAQHLL